MRDSFTAVSISSSSIMSLLPILSLLKKRLRSILEKLGALHHDIAAGLDVDLARPIHRDIFTLSCYRPVLRHADAGAAGFDSDRIAGINHEILSNFCAVVAF